MRRIDISTLNSKLENTIYGVIENNEPIAIAAHKGNVVIISEVDYKLLQDKLNIVSKDN